MIKIKRNVIIEARENYEYMTYEFHLSLLSKNFQTGNNYSLQTAEAECWCLKWL